MSHRIFFLFSFLFFLFFSCFILKEEALAKGGVPQGTNYFGLLPSDMKQYEFGYIDLAENTDLIQVSKEWNQLYFQKLNTKPDLIWLDLFALAAEERNYTLARRVLEAAQLLRPQIIPQLTGQSLVDAHSVYRIAGTVELPAFAVYRRDLHLLELLEKYGIDLKKNYNMMGESITLLELAIAREDMKTVRYLMDRQATGDRFRDYLKIAVLKGSVDMVQFLYEFIQKKAGSNSRPLFSFVFNTLVTSAPLSDDIVQKQIAVVKWVYLQEKHLPRTSRIQRMAMRACRGGHPLALAFLFDTISDEDLKLQLREECRKSVELLLSYDHQNELFKRILNKTKMYLNELSGFPGNSEPANSISREIESPLNQAIFERNIPLIKSLIAQGVDVNGRGREMLTPLDLAVEMGSLPLLKILLEAGATTGRMTRHTLISHLIQRAKLESFLSHRQNNWIRMIRYLYRNHESLGLRGCDEISLVEVAEVGNLSLLQNLIHMGLSPEKAGKSGLTPLQQVEYWLSECKHEKDPNSQNRLMSPWGGARMHYPAGVEPESEKYKEKLEKVRDYLLKLKGSSP